MPVSVAAIANFSATRPDASLSSDSPSSTCMVFGHAQIARDGRNGHGIGGRDHGGQGKGHGQRNLGNHPMDEIAQAQHGEQNQAQASSKMGPVRKIHAWGCASRRRTAAAEMKSSRNSSGVERDVQAGLRPGNQRTQCDLNQRQGMARI